MRRTFTVFAVATTGVGLSLASAVWAQQPNPGAVQPTPSAPQPIQGAVPRVPGAVQTVPGQATPIPGAVQVVPGTTQPAPGAVQVVPGTTQPAANAGQPPAGNQAPIDDRLFVAAAAVSGLAEVTTSTLALQRAGDDEVRQFAQQMVTDHTRANQELLSIAAAKGIGVPQALEITAQADLNVLSGLRGAEFDRAYIRNQVAAHICAVGLFEAESQRGQDPDLRAFAGRTLPTIREHLQHARQHMGQAGGRGGDAARDNDRDRDDSRPRAGRPNSDQPGADRPRAGRPDSDRPAADRAGAERSKDEDRKDEDRKNDERRKDERKKGDDRSKDNDQSR